MRFGYSRHAIARWSVVVVLAGCGGGSGSGGTGEVELEAACGAMEDEGIDGSVDVVWVHEIDVNGRIVAKAGDRDGDGEPEDVFTYEWNDDGRLVAEERSALEFDEGYRLEYEWDGVNLVEYRYLYDEGAGLSLATRRTNTYADGSETQEVWDWDDDGDLVASGRLELEESDGDGDGEIERTETFEYDGDRIVRSTVTASGTPMYLIWTYEGGALVRVEGFPSEPVPPNTVPDYRETWTLDDNDLVVEHRYVLEGVGANHVTTTVRDEEGRPVEIQVTGAGEPNVERMAYEGDRMIRHEIRTPYDTTAYEFQFDCGG
jgi:hypothetical protein